MSEFHHDHSINDQNKIDGSNPYLQISPTPPCGKRPGDRPRLRDVLDRYGKKVENAVPSADNVRNHFKLSPSVTKAARAWLSHGRKMLAEGGHSKMFQKMFNLLPGEKFLEAYVCYLSTPSGPAIGGLYISNKRAAFCSESPLQQLTPSGKQEGMYYKVALEFDQIESVNASKSECKPSERYISIITEDGYEFQFTGFISFDLALKSLTDGLHHSSGPVGEVK